MRIESASGRPTEAVLAPENKEFEPKFAVLTISGKGSSGNSSFAEALAAKYGVSRVFHAGEYVRALRDAGDSIEYIERPHAVDEAVDAEIERLILTASRENPIIIEAKLGGVLSRHLENEGAELPEPRISILKIANMAKRYEIAQRKEGVSGLSERAIRKLSRERDERDKIQWVETHPYLEYWSNILEKNARDDKGRPIYDFFVDSSHSSLEQDILLAHTQLLAGGYIQEKSAARKK